MMASASGSVEIVDLLLQHGADVNVQSKDGEGILARTALECVVMNDYDVDRAESKSRSGLAIIKRLLEAGAVPDGAVTMARRCGWKEAERLLVARHAAFDDEAKLRAKTCAAKSGKPKTQLQGLLAIHAVLCRASFARDQDAWTHYGTSRQRYYEWKALLNGGQPLLRDALCPAKRCHEWVEM